MYSKLVWSLSFKIKLMIQYWWHTVRTTDSCIWTVSCSELSFDRVSTSLGNSGLCWTVFAWSRDTAVPAEGNGDIQTLICVLVARPRQCSTLSNPVPWQNWMVAYLSYTLRMKMLFRGWPVMVHDTHTRRRRTVFELFKGQVHPDKRVQVLASLQNIIICCLS